MNYLLYTLNFKPEKTGIGKYAGELFDFILSQENELIVICGHDYYPAWKGVFNGRFDHLIYSVQKGKSYTIIRCPIIVTGTKGLISRLLIELSFTLSSFPVFVYYFLTKVIKKAIVFVPASFPALLLSLFFKSSALIHIHFQDFPFHAASVLGMVKNKRIEKLLISLEERLFYCFKNKSVISDEMALLVKTKVETPVSVIANWVYIERWPIFSTQQLAIIKEQLGWTDYARVILYSGSLGEKQGIEKMKDLILVLQAYKILFVIQSEGPSAKLLSDWVVARALKHVQVLPFCSEEELNKRIQCADANLILEKKGGGELFSPSKLIPLMLTGSIVLSDADAGSSIRKITEGNLIGSPGASALDLLNLLLSSDSNSIALYRQRIRSIAMERFSAAKVLPKFLA